MNVLIIGRSGRALAASARRAGYSCDVVDQFLDADTRALVGYSATVRRLDRDHLEPVLRKWQAQSILLQERENSLILPGSGFEADSGLISWLESFAPVAANPAAVIHRLKNPPAFAALLGRLGIAYPRSRSADWHEAQTPVRGDWLIKQAFADGGGHIRRWRPRERLAGNDYLQQRVSGTPASVVFLANTHDVRIVGYNRCLHAAAQSGRTDDYRFAGAVRCDFSASLRSAVEAALLALVRAAGLRGLCGMDMLIDEAEEAFHVLEINPRPPASFELHENGSSLVAAHIEACQGRLPAAWKPASGCPGKLVVYVADELHIPAGFNWPDWTADRPSAGGHETDAPLCTIFARETTPEASCELLYRRRHDLLNHINYNLQLTESINLIKEVSV